MSDEELLRDCLDGRGWDAFVERFTPYLSEVCRRTLRRRGLPAGLQEVSDQVQEAFLGLLERDKQALRAYEGRSSVAGYLAAVAIRRIQARRLEAYRPPVERPGPLEELENRESMEGLQEAMKGLAPRSALALRMQAEGASQREVAGALGISEDAAAQLLSRSRAQLRNTLSGKMRDPLHPPHGLPRPGDPGRLP